jgi:hypothetical protein
VLVVCASRKKKRNNTWLSLSACGFGEWGVGKISSFIETKKLYGVYWEGGTK